ncbi:MAG: hypothetical protein E4G99_03275 [Anaerolineales bacterium]|nr:MAG: hypothetical protein E4G99_03275 [Anaerolineales bacterium]
MRTPPHKKAQIVFAFLLLITINACSLLSVERINDPRTLEPTDLQVATFVALESQVEQQGELLRSMATQVAYVSTQSALQGTFIAHLATRGPAPDTQIFNASPTTTNLVIGSVEIEQGRCCAGGTAGDEIRIQVEFSGIGLNSPVTEMRYRTGGFVKLDQDFDSLTWEPYTEEKFFPFQLPINWTGFYIRVQFKDGLGNLSPIYSDDISVEGAPALTATPES